MKNIVLSFTICLFTQSIEAQIAIEKQIEFPDRITSASIYTEQNRNDTIISFNPNPIVVVQEKLFGSEDTPTPPKPKPKPEYVLWNGNKKVLDPNETVIGIYQNKVITNQDSGSYHIVRTYIVQGKEFTRKIRLKIKQEKFDRIECIYNPEGKMYVLHYRNTFAKEKNKKLTCYDTDLKQVFTYTYKYGLWIKYYFANADTFCVYESQEDSHQVSMQLISLSLKKQVFKKVLKIPFDFSSYEIECITTKKGFVLAVNEGRDNPVHLWAFGFKGDTLWKQTMDDNPTDGLYIPESEAIQFFCDAQATSKAPHQIVLSANSGSVISQQLLSDVSFKGYPKAVVKTVMLKNVWVPTMVQSGYLIIPFIYFLDSKKENYSSIFFSGNKSFDFSQSAIHAQVNQVIPCNGKLFIISDKILFFAKIGED